MARVVWLAVGWVGLLTFADRAAAADPPVTVLETPNGGIQPQAALAPDGSICLAFFRGEPGGGDVFFTRTEPGQTRFTAPVRVNSQPGSAIAQGTVRGAQLAVGRDGRVHVAWNGSAKARPANPIQGSPLLYARSNPAGTAFEAQRNLMQTTYELDGGGTVAADPRGNVFVGWHGRSKADPAGERGRRFFVARSRDDGASFGGEEPALDRTTGACGCCGCRGLVDSRGNVYFLYRAARDNVGRDMILLTSHDGATPFRAATLDPWRLQMCPMSTATLAEGNATVVAAWETNGQVFASRIDPGTFAAAPPIKPPGEGNRKHPAVAVTAAGELILVWAEGTGWQRGGALAWQVFDRAGHPLGAPGRIERGVPAWSLPTVVAGGDGGFTIIH